MESLENFGFLALFHSTGPPYSISLDILQQLNDTRDKVDSGYFARDIDFQEYVQSIFQQTLDAHTRYNKPSCYNVIFVSPVAFDLRITTNETLKSEITEPKLFLMNNSYTATYPNVYSSLPLALFGKEVKLLSGVEAITAISTWGDTHETKSNNPVVASICKHC